MAILTAEEYASNITPVIQAAATAAATAGLAPVQTNAAGVQANALSITAAIDQLKGPIFNGSMSSLHEELSGRMDNIEEDTGGTYAPKENPEFTGTATFAGATFSSAVTVQAPTADAHPTTKLWVNNKIAALTDDLAAVTSDAEFSGNTLFAGANDLTTFKGNTETEGTATFVSPVFADAAPTAWQHLTNKGYVTGLTDPLTQGLEDAEGAIGNLQGAIGDQYDAAQLDGSLYARIKRTVDEISNSNDAINTVDGRVDALSGTVDTNKAEQAAVNTSATAATATAQDRANEAYNTVQHVRDSLVGLASEAADPNGTLYARVAHVAGTATAAQSAAGTAQSAANAAQNTANTNSTAIGTASDGAAVGGSLYARITAAQAEATVNSTTIGAATDAAGANTVYASIRFVMDGLRDMAVFGSYPSDVALDSAQEASYGALATGAIYYSYNSATDDGVYLRKA